MRNSFQNSLFAHYEEAIDDATARNSYTLLPEPVTTNVDEESTFASGSVDPIFNWALLQMYGESSISSDSTAAREPIRTLPERLAESLLVLHKAQGGDIRHVSHQSLADSLGTHQETVGAMLRAFRRQGLIEVGYRYIRIIDLESFREFSGVV